MSSQALALINDPLPAIDRELARHIKITSDESRRAYRRDLADFERWRAGREDRDESKTLIEDYVSHLKYEGRPHKDGTQGGPLAPSSINRALAAIRWWMRRRADIIYDDPQWDPIERERLASMVARASSVGDIPSERDESPGKHIDPGELEALIRACAKDDSPAGVRDAAIIGIAWVTGARRSEIACRRQPVTSDKDRKWKGLCFEDYAPDDEGGHITFKHTKGNKTRQGYAFNGATKWLADWLQLRGSEPGPMWYAIDKGGNIQHGEPVGDEALAKMLDKRCAEAGIEHLTWHDFRRTFAGNLLDSGADIVTIQKLMGHSSPVTTSNYDRRKEDTKRRAVRALNVPYRKRS